MDNSLEKIREAENNEITNHLLEIKAIAKQKSIGSGIDKIIGELLLHGIGRFNLNRGFSVVKSISYEKPQHAFSPQEIERTRDLIHKENKDIVRHLVAIRNVVNTKCTRCDGNCMGCGFDELEGFFNIESGMRIIYLYDWNAILEVVKFNKDAYRYTVYEFVNNLAIRGRNGEIIELKEPDFETNYLRTDIK